MGGIVMSRPWSLSCSLRQQNSVTTRAHITHGPVCQWNRSVQQKTGHAHARISSLSLPRLQWVTSMPQILSQTASGQGHMRGICAQKHLLWPMPAILEQMHFPGLCQSLASEAATKLVKNVRERCLPIPASVLHLPWEVMKSRICKPAILVP